MAESKKSTPKTVKNNSAKFPAPRVIKAGKKTTNNVNASPWNSIDPVIPIIQVDWEPPSGNDTAKYDGYGNKKRKSNAKKNGNQF